MTLFWTISAAMMLAALALLAPTLLRKPRVGTDDTEALNVEIARERLRELQGERAAGELSDEEFEQARGDLERALAQDLAGTAQTAVDTRANNGRGAMLMVALLIPLITVPVYLTIGSPQLIDAPAGGGVTSASGELPPIGTLIAQLRERLEANPDNAEGWFLLGRTSMSLENFPQAVAAFERVVALLPEEPAALMSLADALVMAEGQIGARPIALAEKALTIDPNSVTALWLLGNAAAEHDDSAKAIALWQRAYPLLDGQTAMQAELARRISAAGGTPPVATPPAELPPIMPPPAAQPSADATATDGAVIEVEVALAPELFDRVSGDDTLFVFARAENGPPMPLAVARHTVAELPLRVTLSDAMAMMPTMKLSAFARVKVGATVSKRGRAGAQTGDLVADEQVIDSTEPPAGVQLLINRVVE